MKGKTLVFVASIQLARLAFLPITLANLLALKLIKAAKPKCLISIITTGGTAGHVFPAIRFAAYAIKQNKNIHFVSNAIAKNIFLKLGSITKNKFQNKFFYTEHQNEKLGQQFDEKYTEIIATFLPIVPLKLKPKSLLLFAIAMFFGLLKILRHGFFVENVIGFGGYASFPMLFWGAVFCKKIYLHEQNTTIGAVNELFLPFAQKLFTAFPIENKPANACYTGMPLSQNLENQPIIYQSEKKFNQTNGKINILVISGSSGGAESVHSIVPAILLLSKRYKNMLHIYHQINSKEAQTVKEKYLAHNISSTVQPFFENIHGLLPQITLCISRSGASSIVDLLSFGVTTIFIPLKNSARNHQLKNASWVVANNAGFLYKPWESNVYNFAALMSFCLASPVKQNSLKLQSILKKNARAVMFNTVWN